MITTRQSDFEMMNGLLGEAATHLTVVIDDIISFNILYNVCNVCL